MTNIIKVKGGIPLKGDITPVPNKNAILPALCACILTNKPVTYKNIPHTSDVSKMLNILKNLGAKVNDKDYANITIDTSLINKTEVKEEWGEGIRASILFAGPLLARFGKATIPMPGGCVLGKRSISAHIDSFSKVGIKTKFNKDSVTFTAPKKIDKEYNIWQMEASVTATENIFLYTAGIESTFNITECAAEPHVSQLLDIFEQMGIKVKGKESNFVQLKGSKNTNTFTFIPEPDFVGIGGIIVATAITKGNVTIKGANIPRVVDGMIQTFEKFGIKIERKGKDLIVNGNGELKIDALNSGFPTAGKNLPKISPRPWPGFPVDVLPVMVTLACKTKGKLLIQNWMYETGLDFVKELNKMGANIFVADPQRVIVNGPVEFTGGKIETPSIIQATKAIFLASLADTCETTLEGISILNRRYPDVINTYKKLGANIQVLD